MTHYSGSRSLFSLFYFCGKKETRSQVVSFFVNKTINSVLKSGRKIIFRVCEVANVKKQFKMFQMYHNMQRRQNTEDEKEPETTGHDRFYQERSRYSYSKGNKSTKKNWQLALTFSNFSVIKKRITFIQVYSSLSYDRFGRFGPKHGKESYFCFVCSVTLLENLNFNLLNEKCQTKK